MRSPEPLALVPEPPRYPLAIAACWIAGCGVIAGAAGTGVRTELLYLPAILALAWYYGLRYGLAAAVGSALSTFAAEAMMGGLDAGPAILAWNLVSRALLLALPAWLVWLVRSQRRSLAGLSTTDAATGFATRHGLLGVVAEELIRTERLGGETSIVCIGLTGLSRLASERGREQAEAVLAGFVGALRTCARRTDQLARLGEDEFALLLRGTGSKAAMDTADKLAQSLTGWLLTQGNDLSCAVGFTTAPRGRLLDAAALLARAQAHMYERRSARPVMRPAGAVTRAAAVKAYSAGSQG